MHLICLVDVDPTGLGKVRYAPDLCSRGVFLELRQGTDCPALPAGFRGFSQSLSSNWEVTIIMKHSFSIVHYLVIRLYMV